MVSKRSLKVFKEMVQKNGKCSRIFIPVFNYRATASSQSNLALRLKTGGNQCLPAPLKLFKMLYLPCLVCTKLPLFLPQFLSPSLPPLPPDLRNFLANPEPPHQERFPAD